jgi:putative membrane protein
MSTSTVTEHLANERTFLAWVRTSISLMAFGVVIAKLRFLLGRVSMLAPASGSRSTELGIAFLLVGLLTLATATVSYFRARRMIDTQTFQPLGAVLLIFVGAIFLLGAATGAYLLDLWR